MATEVGGADHHFRVVQLPYNLAMPEALAVRSQGERSLLGAATDAGIYVMTSASILQGRLAQHLPESVRARLDPQLETNAQRALQFVRSTPGVGTALVGMKRTEHVDENAKVAALPALPAEATLSLLRG